MKIAVIREYLDAIQRRAPAPEREPEPGIESTWGAREWRRALRTAQNLAGVGEPTRGIA